MFNCYIMSRNVTVKMIWMAGRTVMIKSIKMIGPRANFCIIEVSNR